MNDAARPLDTRTSVRAPRRVWLRSLLGFALLAAMAGGVVLFLRWEPQLLPVRVIEVSGELHHHSSQLLQQNLTERLRGGILTANLVELKGVVESLPWVRQARIRRVWPDRLQVEVEEYQPIARWNHDGLVTADAVIFRPNTRTIPAGLPQLEGEDSRARDVVERYQRWRDELMLAGHLIQTLSVDARGDWRIHLVMGIELRLGTSEVEDRLKRFIANAPQLEAAGQPAVVDLRYSNGFAVKWASHADAQVRANADRAAVQQSRNKLDVAT